MEVVEATHEPHGGPSCPTLTPDLTLHGRRLLVGRVIDARPVGAHETGDALAADPDSCLGEFARMRGAP